MSCLIILFYILLVVVTCLLLFIPYCGGLYLSVLFIGGD